MIAYKEITQIKNVKGLNPITGDYSDREFLYFNAVLFEADL
ncbi:hypothetical protein [uncultured Porphyromonas sp.]|jgi:hypothetical protein|nr:hypothetical protein [uncultured Porphyromonas sp.]